MSRHTIPAFLAFIVLFLVAGCGKPEDDAASRPFKKESLPAQTDNTELWQSIALVADVQPGIGAAHRDDVLRAMNLIKSGSLDGAERLLETILKAFADEINSPGKSHISVANRTELEAFKKEHPAENVVWVDYAFGQALHLYTFIAVARHDFPEALRRSDRVLQFRPYAADSYIERAGILNQLRRPAEALEAYRTAAGLAERFSSSVNLRAAALRGIGFTQVELGDFKAARTAIESSLELEPGNKIALGELEYITRITQQRRAENKGPNKPDANDGK